MKVVIYTTPICPYCKRAKEFFAENRVRYEEVDVAENEKARAKMIEKSGQFGTPVIIVSDADREDVVIGFNRPLLEKLLKLSRK